MRRVEDEHNEARVSTFRAPIQRMKLSISVLSRFLEDFAAISYDVLQQVHLLAARRSKRVLGDGHNQSYLPTTSSNS